MYELSFKLLKEYNIRTIAGVTFWGNISYNLKSTLSLSLSLSRRQCKEADKNTTRPQQNSRWILLQYTSQCNGFVLCHLSLTDTSIIYTLWKTKDIRFSFCLERSTCNAGSGSHSCTLFLLFVSFYLVIFSVPLPSQGHAKKLDIDAIFKTNYILLRFWWLDTGFGLANGSTGLLKLVTTNNYSATANSRTLQFTTVCIMPFSVYLH
jgi:hypothetical protein